MYFAPATLPPAVDAPTRTCACGKTGWLSKADADAVVVQAKIAHALHNNRRRREQRSYACSVDPALYHVTSLAQWVDLTAAR